MLSRLCFVVLFASAAFGQSEMQKLGTLFSGQWNIIDKSEPTATQVPEDARHGQERWYTLGGGSPLIEEYHSKAPDGTDELTAAFWWNSAKQKYAGLFCAAFVDEGCAPFDVEWHVPRQEGDRSTLTQVVLSGEYGQGGKKYSWREVFEFSTPDNFTQTLYLAEGSNELKREAVITATRASTVK